MKVSDKYIWDMIGHPDRKTLFGNDELLSVLEELKELRSVSRPALKGLEDYDVLFSSLETFWCSTADGTDERLLAEGAIDAAKRILSSLSPPTGGWQPIESAPKDGTEIILGGPGWCNAGFYSDDEAQMRRADAGWFFEDDRANLLTARNIDPTHWQPLPSPPEAGK